MVCKKCGCETEENAKFCSHCGSSLQEEELMVTEKQNTENIQPVETADSEKKEEKIWHYTDGVKSLGPYSDQEMKEFIASKTLMDKTLVWKPEMKDWTQLKDTELSTYLIKESVVQEEWYYIGPENAQNGPFTLDQMKSFLQEHRIDGNTFVWRTNMENWVRLKQSDLNKLALSEESKEDVARPSFEASVNIKQDSNKERETMSNQNSNGMAIASLVLGIVAIVFSFFGMIGSLIGLVCGIIGLVCGVKARNTNPSGMATAGLVCSIIGTVFCAVIFAACSCALGSLANLGASGY